MAKYSYEFKHKVVMEYLNNEGGYKYLGKKYSIAQSITRRWIANYREFGEIINEKQTPKRSLKRSLI